MPEVNLSTQTWIDHVQLPVPDLEAGERWYGQTLGFVRDFANDEFVVLRSGHGPALLLWQTEDTTTAGFTRNGEPWPALGFESRELPELQRRLTEQGGRIVLSQRDDYMHLLKVMDPFGNLIAVFQRHTS